MRQNIYTILLVVLIELLWVRIETNGWYSPGQWRRSAMRISAGFPVRAVSFTVHRTTGNMAPWENYPERNEWRPGFRVSPLAQVVVGLSAIALFFGIRWILRFEAARTVFQGIVVGVAFGLLTSLATRSATRTHAEDAAIWPKVIGTLIVLIVLPSVICFLTRHSRSWRDPLLVLAVTMAAFPWASLWCDQFESVHQFRIDSDSHAILKPSFEEMVTVPLIVGCMVLFVLFLLRKFLPRFRSMKPRSDSTV